MHAVNLEIGAAILISSIKATPVQLPVTERHTYIQVGQEVFSKLIAGSHPVIKFLLVVFNTENGIEVVLAGIALHQAEDTTRGYQARLLLPGPLIFLRPIHFKRKMAHGKQA